jgi:hypothetical protein
MGVRGARLQRHLRNPSRQSQAYGESAGTVIALPIDSQG